jgi:hypothetical protein
MKDAVEGVCSFVIIVSGTPAQRNKTPLYLHNSSKVEPTTSIEVVTTAYFTVTGNICTMQYRQALGVWSTFLGEFIHEEFIPT